MKRAASVINVEGVQTAYTYTGSLQTVNSGATLNHGEAELEYSNNTFTTVAEGNNKQVTIRVAQSANYEAAETTVTLTVAKATVEVPTVEEPFTHTGSEIVAVAETDDYSVAEGAATAVGDYTAVLTLKDPDNRAWATPDFDGRISWSIVGAANEPDLP